MSTPSIKYLNNYTPPPPPPEIAIQAVISTPFKDYDFNWAGGEVKEIRTEKLSLIPYVPSLHANQLWEMISHEDKDQLDMAFCIPSSGFSMSQSFESLVRRYEGWRARPVSLLWWFLTRVYHFTYPIG
jgi:hypothetical protein